MSTPNELYAEATCFLCYGITQAEALKLALLRRQALLLDPDADVTPAGLLASAVCFNCFANGNLFDLFELALLAIIAAATGSGTGDGLLWGPNPETVLDFTGPTDQVLNDINNNWFPAASFTELSFGNPVTVSNQVDFTGSATITSLTMRNLESVGGQFNCDGCSSAVLISAPLLQSVGTNLVLSNCDVVTSINLGNLQTVTGNADFSNDLALTNLSLPALITIGGNLAVAGNPNLAFFSAPVWIPTDGTTIDLSVCAINQSSIDHILARCVVAALTTATIDLSGGTNSTPGAQGLLDKATLIGNGCTVNTN